MAEKKLKNKPLFIPDKLPAGYANWQEWYSRNPNPEGRSLFPTEDKSKVKAGKLPKTEKFVDNLIKTYPQYKQYKKEDFLGMLDTIAQVESKNKNIKQQPDGPGRGYFQMETSSAETAQKRLMNIFKELKSKGVTDIDTPAFNKDFTQLKNKDDQALHVIANMIGAAGAKRKATGKEVYVNPKDTKNSWLDYHWAGPEADRPARIKHYESTVKKMDFGGLADYDYNFNSQANSITYLAGKQREARENASRYKSGFIHTVGDTGKMIADNNLSALGLGNVIGSDDYATHLGANTFNDASNVIGEVSKVAAPLVLSAIAGPLAGAAYSAGTSALNEHVNPKEYKHGGEVNSINSRDNTNTKYTKYQKPTRDKSMYFRDAVGDYAGSIALGLSPADTPLDIISTLNNLKDKRYDLAAANGLGALLPGISGLTLKTAYEDIGNYISNKQKPIKKMGYRKSINKYNHGGEVYTTPADSTATKYSKPVINNTPANKHAEPSMFKQAIDFVLKYGTPLPENAAQWGSATATGDRDIRIKDFSGNTQKELYKAIKKAKERTGKNSYGTEYKDYGEAMHRDLQKLKGNVPTAAIASLLSGDFRAATTFGRVSVNYDPKKKLYHVYDSYDFSDVDNKNSSWGTARTNLGKVSKKAGLGAGAKGKLIGTFNEADWDKKIEDNNFLPNVSYDTISNGVNSMYKKAKEVFKFEDGGEVYNQKRADALGYMPDETGHLPSVDYTNGMWLKSKKHPTAFKELQAYLLSAELQRELKHPVVNPEGYFGENQLQYIPKKGDGGMTQTIINIEGQGKQEGDLATMRGKGEYRTDLLGNIKQNYAAFLPHPDGKGRHVASDVMAQEGDVIIPKKYSKQFKNSNKTERERMIMSIISQTQANLGEQTDNYDPKGMKRGGLIKKYGSTGVVTGDTFDLGNVDAASRIFDFNSNTDLGSDITIPTTGDAEVTKGAGTKFDYNKALGLLSPLLKTGRGLFEKVENINPQDYMIRPNLKPELINDNAAQMMINDATNAGMNSLSQTNAAPSARINLAINSMKQKWMAKQEAQKANAQSIMQTNAANAGIRGQDAAMGLSIRDKNDANIAARRNMFMEGTNDLSKFGHQQRYDKAFFEALPMMGNNPEFQKWLKANGYYKTTV